MDASASRARVKNGERLCVNNVIVNTVGEQLLIIYRGLLFREKGPGNGAFTLLWNDNGGIWIFLTARDTFRLVAKMKTTFFATKLGIDIFLFFFIFLFDFLPFFFFSSTSSVSSGEINYSQLVLIQYTLCIVLLHHTFVIAEWICNPLSFAFAYKSSLQRVVPPRNRIKNPSNEIFHKNNFHVNIVAPLGGITRPTCWKSNNPGAPVASL